MSHMNSLKLLDTMSLLLRAAKSKLIPWPMPKHSLDSQDYHFVFILCPGYSGSTAFAKVLNSAHNSMILSYNAEGQRLVPGLMADNKWDPNKNTWDPNKKVEWESVKNTWLSRVNMIEGLVGKVDVVIEKSPPNVVRVDQLVAAFPSNSLITFNRNPYARSASVLYREYHHLRDPEAEGRLTQLCYRVREWIDVSTQIKKWADTGQTVNLTYEKLCQDPQLQVRKIMDSIPYLKGIDVDSPIKVKDYPAQTISNQNRRQVARLSEQERCVIGQELSGHEELLQFFGYTSAWQKSLEEGGAC